MVSGTEASPEILDFQNLDTDSIITPVNVDNYARLLKATSYDSGESAFLVQGFSKGFDLGYAGPQQRTSTSKNLPFDKTGNKFEQWNKVMKEVQLKRYAGPFE